MARGKKGLRVWLSFLGNIHDLVNNSSQTFLVLLDPLYFSIRQSSNSSAVTHNLFPNKRHYITPVRSYLLRLEPSQLGDSR